MIWTSSSLPSGGEKSLVQDAFHDPGGNARLPDGVQTVSVMFAMPFANQSPKGERQGLCLCSPQRGWDRRCAESYRGTSLWIGRCTSVMAHDGRELSELPWLCPEPRGAMLVDAV